MLTDPGMPPRFAPTHLARRGAFAIALLLAPLPARAADPVELSRQVRSILAENCFHCHGPDAAVREGNLRLDTPEGQRKPGIIAPGRPDESELILRIFSPQEDERMPPEASHRELTPAQKETLRHWIAGGAPFPEHWAFVAPQRPKLPVLEDVATRAAAKDAGTRAAEDAATRGRGDAERVQGTRQREHPIDAFVRTRLRREGLALSAEADRERLLRRVTFDLTGLPPTPAEIDAFVGDPSAGAYERVVDRLLASPRFGERLAVEWLDAARYADTHGYQMDRPRAMWPYRDWVIAAFNRNLPYDRFLTEQLAGDLLPGATREQRLATAFNRLHAQNEEGGIVEEEYRVAYVNDRVTTFGTAVLGLTLDCARCHDHKYDPITQRDFYALSAFFQNIDESGALSYKNFSDVMPPPVLKLPDPAAEARLAALARGIQAQEERAAAAREAAAAQFEAWLAARGQTEAGPHDAVVALDFDELAAEGTADAPVTAPPARVVDDVAIGAGIRGGAAWLDGENGFAIEDVPVFTRGDAFSFSLWVYPSSGDAGTGEDGAGAAARSAPAERAVVFHRSLAYTDAGSRGYELVLETGRAAFGLHRMWPGSSLKVVTLEQLPLDAWTHVTLTYDGSSQAAGARIYLNGVTAPVEVVRDKLAGDITYDRKKQPPLLIGHRFRDHGFKGGRVDEFRVFGRELSPLEASHLAGRPDLAAAWRTPAPELSREQRMQLRQHFVRTVAAGVRAELDVLAALRREHAEVYDAVPEVMVMEEMPVPRPAYRLDRGEYDRRRDPVSADTPAVLPPFPPGAPRNRLGLAQLATDPANPLTPRVAVNRFWQMMFGRGLVESPDNFGVTGAAPSHPELLDWLAAEFVAGGWDVKGLLRMIALSVTYRQSSYAPPELRMRDPENVLLARGPARRLTAEMLRDQALAVSGLLVERLGGPSVKPYQPAGLWEEIAMGRPAYEQGTGDAVYRRSLYTFWKRTVPHPAMITFDAADRAICTVRRQATSTPLQALALLNDVQLVEAARFVALRMLGAGASAEEQVRHGFRLVTGRTPRPGEVAVLRSALAEQNELFSADPAAARALLEVGERRAGTAFPAPQLAAATMIASLLLNHDEAVMRR
jgi:mono/diheme cytochrome c family protein